MKSIPICGKVLSLDIAIRQLITGSRRYVGVCIVAVLLVFFASIVGRMNAWLGPDGKGMMDAFNPADLDIGVQFFGDQRIDEMEEVIYSFSEITDSYMLAMPNVTINGIDYTANVISDPERFHILQGTTSTADNEVVLTEFVAEDMGITVGDSIIISADAGSAEYIVSGIYQCANDMGDNIGMSREGYLKIGQDNPQIWCHHIFLSDPSQKDAITEALKKIYGGDVHVHENSWPGLLGIISAMHALVMFMYVVVILFILIVTVMTGNKILFMEQKDYGIYKAVGLSSRMLQRIFALRFGLIAIIGSVIGTLLAFIFTDPIVASIMKLAGISNFTSSPSIEIIIFPAFIVSISFTFFAYLAARKIKRVELMILISE